MYEPTSGPEICLSNHPSAVEIVQCLWGPRPSSWRLFNGERCDELDLEAYFDYYQRQWQYFAQQEASCFKGFDDLRHTVEQLNRGVEYADLKAELAGKQASKEEEIPPIQGALNLASRVLVMAKVGRLEHEVVAPGRGLEWQKGTLRKFLNDHFQEPPRLGCEGIRLPKSFDAWSLENIGGVAVEFTGNLADHLRLVRDDTVVLVFHHASFLEFQLGSESQLPPGLAKETLRTLALLFPQAVFGHRVGSSKKRRKWLRVAREKWQQRSGCRVDRRVSCCGTEQADTRQIETFHYWRDRLVILKQTYDDATPRTVAQWWYDRRNGAQWYPFWIALMVFAVATLLALIQVVEGALQVYGTFHPPG